MNPESLKAQQPIIALVVLVIVAATIGGVFWKGDSALINTVAGMVVGTGLGGVVGFFFGSAKNAPVPVAVPASAETPKQ